MSVAANRRQRPPVAVAHLAAVEYSVEQDGSAAAAAVLEAHGRRPGLGREPKLVAGCQQMQVQHADWVSPCGH